MALNCISELLCKCKSKDLSPAEVTRATSVTCGGSLMDGCNWLSPWYLRIDSRSYKSSKVASTVFKSLTRAENAEVHAGTVHRTDGNEQLNLIGPFSLAEYDREVRIPPPFCYDDSNDTPF